MARHHDEKLAANIVGAWKSNFCSYILLLKLKIHRPKIIIKNYVCGLYFRLDEQEAILVVKFAGEQKSVIGR